MKSTRNRGYHMNEEHLSDLVCRVFTKDLALPGGDIGDVTSHDAIGLVGSILAGQPIGVLAVTNPRSGVVVDGARRLAALVAAFMRPVDGGLSIADPTSDAPTVVAGSRPGGRRLGEYLPLAVILAASSYTRWRAAVVAESNPPEQVFDRIERVAADIVGYTVPVVYLPHGADPVEARARFQVGWQR